MSKIAVLAIFVALMSACDEPEEILLELEEKHEVVSTKTDGERPPLEPAAGSAMEEEHELIIKGQ